MVSAERAHELRNLLVGEILYITGKRPDENSGVAGLLHQVRLRANRPGSQADEQNREHRVINEHWAALHRAGLVEVVAEQFWLTDFGRDVLTGKRGADVSPHDRTGYMASVRDAGGDTIALAYAHEAVGAWQAHVDRAAVVMIGAACERLVIMLAESIAGREFPSFHDKLRKLLNETTHIATLFSKTREALESAKGGFASEVQVGLDRRLTSVFEHVRTMRNEQGHPTGTAITHEEAHAALVLFPGFYRSVVAIICEVERTLPARTT
jgi:hypothetical protein